MITFESARWNGQRYVAVTEYGRRVWNEAIQHDVWHYRPTHPTLHAVRLVALPHEADCCCQACCDEQMVRIEQRGILHYNDPFLPAQFYPTPVDWADGNLTVDGQAYDYIDTDTEGLDCY